MPWYILLLYEGGYLTTPLRGGFKEVKLRRFLLRRRRDMRDGLNESRDRAWGIEKGPRQKYFPNFEKSLLEVGDPSILGEFSGNFGEFPIVNHKGKSRVADFRERYFEEKWIFLFRSFFIGKVSVSTFDCRAARLPTTSEQKATQVSFLEPPPQVFCQITTFI